MLSTSMTTPLQRSAKPWAACSSLPSKCWTIFASTRSRTSSTVHATCDMKMQYAVTGLLGICSSSAIRLRRSVHVSRQTCRRGTHSVPPSRRTSRTEFTSAAKSRGMNLTLACKRYAVARRHRPVRPVCCGSVDFGKLAGRKYSCTRCSRCHGCSISLCFPWLM
uniref:Uncharacterized protein n=1 Tax=Triticum urartu TaxID=4572 RepID=A0A8R7RAR6_TRIUA